MEEEETSRELTVQEQEEVFKRYIADNTAYDGLIIRIEDDTTDGAWAEFFADVNTERKKREAWFDTIKKPLNEALAVVRAQEHQVCDKLREVESSITSARGAWMRKKMDEIAAANKAAIKEAETSGGEIALIQPKPTQTVHTSSGASVGLAKQPSWRFTDNKFITAKSIDADKLEFDRDEPQLVNVPNRAFVLKKGLIMALLKAGSIPEGAHSIEKFDDFKSTSK